VIFAALLAAVIAVVVWQGDQTIRALRRQLDDERARTRELLTLLEAKAAPAEHAAYALPPVPVEETHWLSDETGLLLTRIDD